MSARPAARGHALIAGRPVPLADCAWVLRAACGCPEGVTAASVHPSESGAWLAVCGRWKAVAMALRRSARLELMRMSDPAFSAVLEQIGGPCPHQGNNENAKDRR